MLSALAYLVLSVLRIAELLVIGRVLASWVDADRSNFIVRVLFETTQPLFDLVRPLARKIPGPLDWSAMIVLIGIEFVRRVIFGVIS